MRSAAIKKFRRAELERWIIAAIDLLDTLDGDPDLEDDELEETIDEDGQLCGRLILMGCRAGQ